MAPEIRESALNLCSCGAEPELVKLFEAKRYDCFVRCPQCGKEGKVYTSKQNAIKAWNRDNPRDQK